MRIAIGLYERFTSLDAMGPFQVLSSLPGAQLTFVAERPGPVTDESGFLTVTAHAAFADLPDPDILLVPGGIITGTLVPHHPIVGWIARAHRTTTWTTSVCTGSLLLAGAGVLEGVDATTHWRRWTSSRGSAFPVNMAIRHKHLKLDQAKIDRARRLLGVKTEQETLERALDALLAEEPILRAHRGVRRVGGFADPFGRS